MHMYTLNISLVSPASCRKLKKRRKGWEGWRLLAFVGYGWFLGSCLQEGSAAHTTLYVSQAQALGCFAIQANPFSFHLLTTEGSEHLWSQRAHVLYQMVCPWGLAYACMVVAASFSCRHQIAVCSMENFSLQLLSGSCRLPWEVTASSQRQENVGLVALGYRGQSPALPAHQIWVPKGQIFAVNHRITES